MGYNAFSRSVAYDNDAKLLELLRNREYAAIYLADMMAENDDALTKDALLTIAKAQEGGVKAVAEKAGVNKGNVYDALKPDGNPSFALITKIAMAMGLSLTANTAP